MEVGLRLDFRITVFTLHNVLQIMILFKFSAYAEVYLAKKIGGLDDNKLYALKAINVPYVVAREKVYNRNSINNEREVSQKCQYLTTIFSIFLYVFSDFRNDKRSIDNSFCRPSLCLA